MKLFFQKYPRNSENTVLKQTIFFLHGMGGTGQIWRPVAAHFEDRFSVFCPDQRGHGKSPTSDEVHNFSPLDFARDLEETFSEISEIFPTWMIGHSMGCRTASAFAALYPDQVKGLVLIDLGLSGAAGGGIGEILALFLDMLPDSFPTREDARAFLAHHCPDPAIAQYLLAVSHISASGELTFPFQKRALLLTIEQTLGDGANAEAVRKFVSATGRPVWILRGEKSLVYEHSAFMRDQELMKDFPSVKFLEFPNAGHGLPFERRVEFCRWLDGVMSRPLGSNE